MKGYAIPLPGQPETTVPRNLGALLAEQARAHGHAPFLTYYDDVSGERTELSYATFDNWVSKTANLLQEEVGAGRGRRLFLGVTDHWLGAVVVAAAWKLGTAVDLRAPDAASVIVVAEADRGSVPAHHSGLVVIGEGIGGRVAGDGPGLPLGDEVLAFGDDYDDPDVAISDTAMVGEDSPLTHGEIYENARGLLAADARLLVTRPLETTALALAAPLCAGASLVWCPRPAGADLARRAADERLTHRLDEGGSIGSV